MRGDPSVHAPSCVKRPHGRRRNALPCPGRPSLSQAIAPATSRKRARGGVTAAAHRRLCMACELPVTDPQVFPNFPPASHNLSCFQIPLCHKMWSRFGWLTTKHRCGLLHPRDTSKPPNRLISNLPLAGSTLRGGCGGIFFFAGRPGGSLPCKRSTSLVASAVICAAVSLFRPGCGRCCVFMFCVGLFCVPAMITSFRAGHTATCAWGRRIFDADRTALHKKRSVSLCGYCVPRDYERTQRIPMGS